MTADDFEIAALIVVMLTLAYGVYLLKFELRGAAEALHAIVRSQQSLKAGQENLQAQIDALKAERGA